MFSVSSIVFDQGQGEIKLFCSSHHVPNLFWLKLFSDLCYSYPKSKIKFLKVDLHPVGIWNDATLIIKNLLGSKFFVKFFHHLNFSEEHESQYFTDFSLNSSYRFSCKLYFDYEPCHLKSKLETENLRFRSKLKWVVLEEGIVKNFRGPFLMTYFSKMFHIYCQTKKNKNLSERPLFYVRGFLKLVGYEISCWKLLKLNEIPESHPTVWELTSFFKIQCVKIPLAVSVWKSGCYQKIILNAISLTSGEKYWVLLRICTYKQSIL